MARLRVQIIAFVDYDGPLYTCDPGTDSEFRWQPAYLQLLSTFCRSTGAKIVVVSSRRFATPPPEELRWNIGGLSSDWILPRCHDYPRAIEDYMTVARQDGPAEFVVIDDDVSRYAGASEEFMRRLVLCGNRTGFNQQKYEQATSLVLELLNGPNEKKSTTENKHDDTEY